MTRNRYVEYAKWVGFWGLFINSEKEVQKFMDKYNKENYRVVQFQWTSPKLDIGKIILVLIVTILTLGFMSYWSGFSIIFEKEITK